MSEIKYKKGSLGWLREKAKGYGFGNNVREFVKWAQKNGILSDPSKLEHDYRNNLAKRKGCDTYTELIVKRAGFYLTTEYQNFCAQKRGYKDYAETVKERNWNKGKYTPLQESDNCPAYLGVHIAERKIARIVLPRILGNIKKEMSYGNPGFDFIIEGDTDIKVDVKSRKLSDNKWPFMIRYNNITDYFLLIGFDDRENLYCMRIWLFHRNDLVIKGSVIIEKFWKRECFSITNTIEKLKKFEKYEYTDKLSEKERDCKEDES